MRIDSCTYHFEITVIRSMPQGFVILVTHKEDLTEEQIRQRAVEMFQQARNTRGNTYPLWERVRSRKRCVSH